MMWGRSAFVANRVARQVVARRQRDGGCPRGGSGIARPARTPSVSASGANLIPSEMAPAVRRRPGCLGERGPANGWLHFRGRLDVFSRRLHVGPGPLQGRWVRMLVTFRMFGRTSAHDRLPPDRPYATAPRCACTFLLLPCALATKHRLVPSALNRPITAWSGVMSASGRPEEVARGRPRTHTDTGSPPRPV